MMQIATDATTNIVPPLPRRYTHKKKQREFLNVIQKHCTYLGGGTYLAATTYLAPLLDISQPAACQRRKTFARQTGAVISGQFITVPLSMIKAEVKRLRWRGGDRPKPYTRAHGQASATITASSTLTIEKSREAGRGLGPEQSQQGGQELADSPRPPEVQTVSVCPACARPAELVLGACASDGRVIDPFWTCRRCMQTDGITGRTHLMWRSARQWRWKVADAAARALSTLRDSVYSAARKIRADLRETVLRPFGFDGWYLDSCRPFIDSLESSVLSELATTLGCST